jgi:hypothetical protein
MAFISTPLFKHVRSKGEITSLGHPGYADIAYCEEAKSDVKIKPHGSHTQPKRSRRFFEPICLRFYARH